MYMQIASKPHSEYTSYHALMLIVHIHGAKLCIRSSYMKRLKEATYM